MWRSVPRALYVGYAIPVVVIAAWMVAWMVGYEATWMRQSVVQVAEGVTAAVMIAIGAFEAARAQTGWRATAAWIAGIAVMFRIAPIVAGMVFVVFSTKGESAMLVAATALTGIEYVGSAAAVISAAGLAATSRRLTIALVVAAIGLATLQHPPPVLYQALYRGENPDWAAVLVAAAPLGLALVILGAVGNGLSGKRLGLRRVGNAVRGSRLAGAAAWVAAAGAAGFAIVSLTGATAGATASGIVGMIVAIGLVAAATSIARAHHEGFSSLLVNIALAGAIGTLVALCYLLARWGAVSASRPLAMTMWVRGEAPPVDYLPTAALCDALVLACLGVALWRYARHRRATRLARELGIRLGAFAIALAVAFTVTSNPLVIGTAVALGCTVLAGGFFAAARELERDVVDPTAAVFA